MSTTTQLKRIATLTTTVTDDGPRPLIGLENLQPGTGTLLPDAELAESTSPKAGVADVCTGDVLFGKLRPYLAKTWVADRPARASTELLCMHPQPGIDSRWLGYAVASSPLVDWAVATSDGAKMPRTSWERLGEFRIIVPPIATQRAISDYLDRETARIDALIAAKNRMVELLDEQRQAWLTSLLQEASSWTRLKHVARIQGGLTLGKTYESTNVQHWPYLRVANVQANSLDLSDIATIDLPAHVAARHRLIVGDLLLAEGNGNPDNLGRAVIWQGEIANCLHQNHVFALRTGPQLRPKYLEAVLATANARRHFRQGASQVGIASISQEKVLDLKVPLPPIEDQDERIASIADHDQRTVSLRLHVTKQIGLLQERRQTLVTAAIAGQLDNREGA